MPRKTWKSTHPRVWTTFPTKYSKSSWRWTQTCWPTYTIPVFPAESSPRPGKKHGWYWSGKETNPWTLRHLYRPLCLLQAIRENHWQPPEGIFRQQWRTTWKTIWIPKRTLYHRRPGGTEEYGQRKHDKSGNTDIRHPKRFSFGAMERHSGSSQGKGSPWIPSEHNTMLPRLSITVLGVWGNWGEVTHHVWRTAGVSPRSHTVEHPLRRSPSNSPAPGSEILGIHGWRRTSREGHWLHGTRTKATPLGTESKRLANTERTLASRPQVWVALNKVQRRMSLRVVSAYCTVSGDGAGVIAGIAPLDLLAKERKQMYEKRKHPNSTSDENITAEWQNRWDRSSKVRWTLRLIPVIVRWTARRHGEVNFHLTQALSGHECFAEYLNRFGKLESSEWWYCEHHSDDAYHTVFMCYAWHARRMQWRRYWTST